MPFTTEQKAYWQFTRQSLQLLNEPRLVPLYQALNGINVDAPDDQLAQQLEFFVTGVARQTLRKFLTAAPRYAVLTEVTPPGTAGRVHSESCGEFDTSLHLAILYNAALPGMIMLCFAHAAPASAVGIVAGWWAVAIGVVLATVALGIWSTYELVSGDEGVLNLTPITAWPQPPLPWETPTSIAPEPVFNWTPDNPSISVPPDVVPEWAAIDPARQWTSPVTPYYTPTEVGTRYERIPGLPDTK